MKITGLITEYNPFHNGHLYHLNMAKKLTGSEAAVAVMSGDFTQRGFPAIVDKYARCRMALEAGVDAVFELPVYHALGSAERFAAGGVSLLSGLGAETLVYGCERDEILDDAESIVASEAHDKGIKTLAGLLAAEPERFKDILKEKMKQGASFPSARKQAVFEMEPEYAKLLDSPNNTLAIEYEKAIIKSGSAIRAGGIIRSDSGYYESGTEIRRAVNELDYLSPELLKLMPESSSRELKYHMDLDLFSELLNYRLWTLSEGELLNFSDVSGDIAARIMKLRDRDYSFSEFVDNLTTRNITQTRARRALMHVLLGIEEGESDYELPYARLLGFRSDSAVMKRLREGKLPIVSKLADAPRGSWDQDDRVSRIYNQVVRKNFGYDISDDYRHGPVIL